MDLDEIKRGLRAEIKKRENEQYFTFQCNVRQMCKDVLAKLEEQEVDVVKLKAENKKLKESLKDTKRALWRAIALFCARSCEYFSGIMSHCLIGQEELYKKCEKKKNKYLFSMYKCRAKFKEFKDEGR